MSEIQWGTATLSWTEQGYRLTMHLWLQGREAALFNEGLTAVLASLGPLQDESWTAEFQRAVRTEDERSVSVEPGYLAITTTRAGLFATDPGDLRAALDELAERCTATALEQRGRDEEAAHMWLDRLRREDSE